MPGARSGLQLHDGPIAGVNSCGTATAGLAGLRRAELVPAASWPGPVSTPAWPRPRYASGPERCLTAAGGADKTIARRPGDGTASRRRRWGVEVASQYSKAGKP